MSKTTNCSLRPRTKAASPGWLIAALWLLGMAMSAPVALGADADDATEARAPIPLVRDAYARAVPPGQGNSAAFMRIINPSAKALALVGASSSVARVVELHTHAREDGMMKMRRVERIEIPAKSEVVLQPGGLHLMLIELKQSLAPNDLVDLRLLFDNGSATEVTAQTRAIVPRADLSGHPSDQMPHSN
ncbi:hypothetical protein Thiowin_04980 [Thiorhodovibrio winogradskyi]|uniref:Copper chaperone PCu(A)C n=1 Tax=Thiorhodovibrio winogradskyi TaxID=77007 RepID=A0ABZ0SGN6_9GAMM|nr:copper chaperone PCu(A)C [Thiorhodovibrio winogradskyi]